MEQGSGKKIAVEKVGFKNVYGQRLAGTLHLPERGNGYGVVIAHCFTCSRHISILTRVCNDLAQEGFIALRFDFSGNGQSEGDFTDTTYTRHVSEVKSAAALLRLRGAQRVFLAGHSMGATIALIAGSQMPEVPAICCIGGRLSRIDTPLVLNEAQRRQIVVDGTFSFVSRNRKLRLKAAFFEDAARYNLPEILKNLSRPILVLHGASDEIIPVKEAEKAFDLNPEMVELAVLADVDHMFLKEADRIQASGRITQWFAWQAGLLPLESNRPKGI